MLLRSLKFRLHDWLADHVRRVQYPRQRYIPARPQRPFWRYQMPLLLRINLALASLAALLGSLVLLAVGLLFCYFLLRAVFA